MCSWMQPPGSPAAAVTRVLSCGSAGLLLPLLVLEGPAHSMADGWRDARVSRRFNPAGPSVGQGLPSPHCVLAVCLVKLCFACGLHLIGTKGNGASLFTFHLPMSSCNCSLIPVELQPSGRDLPLAWQGCSCCSMMSYKDLSFLIPTGSTDSLLLPLSPPGRGRGLDVLP